MNREFRRRQGPLDPRNVQSAINVPDLRHAPPPTPQQMQQMVLHAWREAGARVMVEVNTKEEGLLLLNIDHIVALTKAREIHLQNKKLTVLSGDQWDRLLFWFLAIGTEEEQKTAQQPPTGREEGQ